MYKGIKIGIVTPTRGDRPAFLEFCRRQQERQSVQADMISIVDYPPESNEFDLIPRYRRGFEELFRRGCDVALLWEDDDWYCPEYVRIMVDEWIDAGKPDLFGINETLYYNIRIKMYQWLRHPGRASAMASMATKAVLGINFGQENGVWMDLAMWQEIKNSKAIPMPDGVVICIGIKHGVGRCGGMGHRQAKFYAHRDHKYGYLETLIDEEAMEFYKSGKLAANQRESRRAPGLTVGGKLTVAGLAPHINIHGGIRRYFEIGNELARQGHTFHLFAHRKQQKEVWMECLGELKPYEEFDKREYDLAFTGAEECFESIGQIRARQKVILVVAKFYAQKYKDLWALAGGKYRWIGVASEWNTGMEEIRGECNPGGVNTEFFTPAGPRLPREGRLRVCFYGRNNAGRGVEELVRLAGTLKDLGVEFTAFDAVNWPSVPEDNGVKLAKVSRQEELRQIYRENDIVLSAMPTAGWNNVIAEGMACGCFPAATPAGVKDLIIDGVTGSICADAAEMSRVIQYLDRERGFLAYMQNKAREQAQKFSWSNFVNKLIAGYS